MKELGILDEVKFVHPKDMQDGKVEISDRDITTNLPFVESAHLAFDHHASESDRIGNGKPNHVIDPTADSTARVVYEYFGGGRTTFDIPLDLDGTRFQVAAWRSLAQIPFGSTTTYGHQAAGLGIPTAARAIGAANGANPVCIVLPCHRVIGSDGSLTGFGGGLPVKRWLLDHEARVLANSPSSVPGEGRGGGSTSSIDSTHQWQHRQSVQTRLSMPVG